MALTLDVLKANAVLAGLSADQLSAIVTLSTNDEASVIGARIGELHGDYDRDVLATSGIPKNQGEKSYDYAKRIITTFKQKADQLETLNTQISTLTTEKANLEKQIHDNSGDTALKQKLTDTETQLSDLRTLYDTEKATYTTEKEQLQNEIHSTKVDFEFSSALSGLKFKSTIPESVQSILINNAKNEINKLYKADFVDGPNGKSLVFRDADGKIVGNPENKLNPFTAQELITSKLKDVIDFGKNQRGADTGKFQHRQQDNNSQLDLSSAKTQVEADDIISKHLLESGITRQNPEFGRRQSEVRKENEVEKLPLR